jgi:hypothetical protein
MDFPLWVPIGLIAIALDLYFGLRAAGREPPAEKP